MLLHRNEKLTFWKLIWSLLLLGLFLNRPLLPISWCRSRYEAVWNVSLISSFDVGIHINWSHLILKIVKCTCIWAFAFTMRLQGVIVSIPWKWNYHNSRTNDRIQNVQQHNKTVKNESPSKCVRGRSFNRFLGVFFLGGGGICLFVN